LPDLAVLVEPLLVVRRVLREQIGILHRHLLTIVRDDDVCRRLMTVPGVGPVVALTYRATVDVPARFKNSKAVGASFGLTSSKYQSGEIDRGGRISRCGDEMMRAMLYEAAQVMLTRTQVVLAQGLGDADRQAPRDEKGNRRSGAPVGRDPTPHLD
jgi:transposase